jgi:hypothetical protein
MNAANPKKKIRDRSKNGAGKSEVSYIKHKLVERAAKGQATVMGSRYGRGVIIDMHAGDGAGVDKPQLDLFEEHNPSCATAELATNLAEKLGNTDVILCEHSAKQRALLEAEFQNALILPDHSLAASHISNEYKWGLVLNDPNGPSDQGVEAMREIGERLKICDFVIVFNEGRTSALLKVRDTSAETEASDSQHTNAAQIRGVRECKHKYKWMLSEDLTITNFSEWKKQIGRTRISTTGLVKATPHFRYRVLVVSNFLTDAALRGNFKGMA